MTIEELIQPITSGKLVYPKYVADSLHVSLEDAYRIIDKKRDALKLERCYQPFCMECLQTEDVCLTITDIEEHCQTCQKERNVLQSSIVLYIKK